MAGEGWGYGLVGHRSLGLVLLPGFSRTSGALPVPTVIRRRLRWDDGSVCFVTIVVVNLSSEHVPAADFEDMAEMAFNANPFVSPFIPAVRRSRSAGQVTHRCNSDKLRRLDWSLHYLLLELPRPVGDAAENLRRRVEVGIAH